MSRKKIKTKTGNINAFESLVVTHCPACNVPIACKIGINVCFSCESVFNLNDPKDKIIPASNINPIIDTG